MRLPISSDDNMSLNHFTWANVVYLFQAQQVHAGLQGPRKDSRPDPQAADDARQAGAHLQGALHPHAVPRLTHFVGQPS